jgi:glycosyltransferase involved in cell wall biosynthesis
MHHQIGRVPVSIIIANYNYARFLRRSIDSALGQDYGDVEVVVVDDASDDESREIIKSYGSRIRSCPKARNGGHAAAFNTGFAACSGQVVFFLDADDYLYLNAVSEVTEAWDADTTQAQFRLHIVDENRQIKDIFPPPELPFDDGNVVPKLLRSGRYQTTVTSGLAFDRSVLETILPIPEDEFRQGADGYLVTVAPLYGNVTSIDHCLGAYRQHGANHSQFEGKLAERARWRTRHDFYRFKALSRQATKAGLKLLGNVGLRDPGHLEGRLASLCVDSAQHPVSGDSRLGLAAAGVAASLTMNASLRRRAFTAAWFLSVGVLPVKMAKAVLSWKLVASSRPAGLARMSKFLRRVVG